MGKIFLALVMLFTAPAAQAVDAKPSLGLEGWVAGRLKEMTLKEKIGQMLMVGVYGDRITPSEAKYLTDNAIGNVILFDRNIDDEDQLKGMTSYLQESSLVATGVPLIIAIDQEGGPVSRLDRVAGLKTTRHSAKMLGKTMEFAPQRARNAIYRASLILGRRMNELGINMNLAPVLDLAPEDNSYIHSRSFGPSPDIVVAAASSFARGLKEANIISTGKHFPNLGYTVEDSHHVLPIINRKIAALQDYEFKPFAQLKNTVDVMMIGHVLVPEIDRKHPTSISRPAIDLLRNNIGFSGVIISDDLKMKALTDRYSVPEITLRSVHAGVDILLAAWEKDKQLQMITTLERAVKRKVISEERINQSVARILTLKYRYLVKSSTED